MNASPSWHRTVPRVLTVIVALLAVQYLAGLAARTMAIRYSEAATSTRVRIAHARVSLHDHALVLSGLQIADPSRPDETLVSADACELPIAVWPLLHKQAVVERGTISGMRVDPSSIRATRRNDQAQWFSAASDEPAKNCLTRLGKQFETDLLSKLPSVAHTNALCDRWPAQAAETASRGKDLERRASELSQAIEAADTNPLRNDEFFQELPAQLAALQVEFDAFGADVNNLPESIEAERRAIVAARRDDEKVLREQLRLDEVDADALSTYLLRDQVAARLDDLMGWFHWARQVLPTGRGTASTPTRGEEMVFASCRPLPGALIQALRLEGSTSLAGQPVKFRGTLSDLASTPALHYAPLSLRLSTAGPLPVDLQASIDRTGTRPRDTLLVECQGLKLPQQTWGDAKQLQIKLAPSLAAINLSVSLDGDDLTGDIQLIQNDVRMTPLLGGDSTTAALAEALIDSLGRTNTLAAKISLAGTLNAPTCRLSSNAGTVVAGALVRAEEQTRDDRVAMLMAEAGRRVDEQLASLERKASDEQASLAKHATSVMDNLQRTTSGTSPRHRMSAEKVGRSLPDTSLFR
jgi:uncharacterized protein (TIGR03545 family)